MRLLRVLLGLGASGFLLIAAIPAHAQTGTVRGQITDQATGQPISNVLVSVVGTNRSVRSDQEGMYELAGLPVGNITIRAATIGYGAETVTVAVVHGL